MQFEGTEASDFVATESSVKRRGFSIVPLLVAVVLLLAGFTLWPQVISTFRGPDTRSQPTAATSQLEEPSPQAPSRSPDARESGSFGEPATQLETVDGSVSLGAALPMEARRLLVIVRTNDTVVGLDVDTDGTANVIDFDTKSAVHPDVFGAMVATRDVGGVLRAGPVDDLGVVDVQVELGGFVWHQTQAGVLLYQTSSPSGEPELVRRTFGIRGVNRELISNEPGQPVWYGPSGYALLDRIGRGSIGLYNNANEKVSTVPLGTVVGEIGPGMVAYANDVDGVLTVDLSDGTVAPFAALEAADVGSPEPSGASLLARPLDFVAVQAAQQRDGGVFAFGPEGLGRKLPERAANGPSMAFDENGEILVFAAVAESSVEVGGDVSLAQIGLMRPSDGPETRRLSVPIRGSIKAVRVSQFGPG